MNRQEILDTVESVHREWQVERHIIFSGLEEAFTAAIRKHLRIDGEIQVAIDRATGEIRASHAGEAIDLGRLGRMGYQSAKQRFVQLLKEARDQGIVADFTAKRGGLVNAQVLRTERGIVLLRVEPRYEGILPPREQIPGESYLPGSRILALAKDVERKGADVRFLLSRACDEFVVKLLEREVPEVQSGSCRVRGVARDPGYRTKIFVESTRENVDCVGACVGVERSRIRSLVSELGGEQIDLIPWSDDSVERVRQAMKPAEILEVHPDRRRRRATVYVRPGELSQAIGKSGRNVRLAVRLTGWEIDVFEHPGEPPAQQLVGKGAGEAGILS